MSKDAREETKRQIEANRAMWNATAAVHERVSLARLLEAVRDPTFSTFDAVERAVMDELELAGKVVAQLCCNNGRELISCLKAGAAKGVGFDISDAFTLQARRLAEAAGVEAAFVQGSVYDIPARYDATFDLVYVTVGALGWLPDLAAFYRVAARLLRPGGHLFIYEMHPILFMFEPDTGLKPKRSYFDAKPDVVEAAPDYLDPSQTVAAVSYWYQHPLGEVIGGALSAGLTLRRFDEYPHDRSTTYAAFETLATKPPLSYALLAQKPTRRAAA